MKSIKFVFNCADISLARSSFSSTVAFLKLNNDTSRFDAPMHNEKKILKRPIILNDFIIAEIN